MSSLTLHRTTSYFLMATYTMHSSAFHSNANNNPPFPPSPEGRKQRRLDEAGGKRGEWNRAPQPQQNSFASPRIRRKKWRELKEQPSSSQVSLEQSLSDVSRRTRFISARRKEFVAFSYSSISSINNETILCNLYTTVTAN